MQTFRRIYVARALSIMSTVLVSGIMTSPVTASATSTITDYTNGDTTITSSEVRVALNKAGNVLPDSADVQTSSDSSMALKAVSAGITIAVPKDAKKGVVLEGADISISLPNANKSSAGIAVANGVVAYPGSTGFANAVQANTDGSMRMLTVIDNLQAPTSYDYKVDMAKGGSLQMMRNGGVAIFNTKGEIIRMVDTPWAKDANGKAVRTSYTVNGNVITQHVAHNVNGVAYPVTADPRVVRHWYGTYIYLNRDETGYLAIGATAALSARIGGAGAAAFGAAGGAWLADIAKRHGQCIAGFMPTGYVYMQIYLTGC